MRYQKIKDGGMYQVVVFGIDQTDKNYGKEVVIYHPEDNKGRYLVKEKHEFFEQFRSWESPDES